MYGEEEEEIAAKSEDPIMKEIWENKIPVVDINVKPVFQGEQALINWVNIIISIKIYLYSSIYCNFFFKSF